MNEITSQLLVGNITEWSETIAAFYEKFYASTDDFSFKRLLTTMIDTEKEYIPYVQEKIGGLDLRSIFSTDSEFVFEQFRESLDGIEDLSKAEFLRKATGSYSLLIENLNRLSVISRTDSGKELFKKLADDKKRQMMILRDRLELEELV